MEARLFDQAGREVSGAVSFTSADTAVAPVTTGGLVTGRKAGVTTLTARAGTVTDSVQVQVSPVATRLVVTPSPAAVSQNSPVRLAGRILDATGDPVPGVVVTYAGTVDTLARVSAEGLITPTGGPGQLTVVATAGEFTVEVPVTIVPVAWVVVPDEAYRRIPTGRALQLRPTVRDYFGRTMPAAPVTFTSLAPGLFTVSPTGLLQALSSAGEGDVAIISGTASILDRVEVASKTTPRGYISVYAATTIRSIGVAVAADERVVVAGGDQVGFLSVAQPHVQVMNVDGDIQDVALSPDDNVAWLANMPVYGVTGIRVTTRVTEGSLPVPNREHRQVLYSGDTTRILVSGPGGVAVIDAGTRQLERDIAVPTGGRSMRIVPGGTTVLVGGEGPLYEVDYSTGSTRLVTSEPIHSFSLSLDGATVFSVDNATPTLRRFRRVDGLEELPALMLPAPGWGISTTPDGHNAVVSSSAGHVLRVSTTQQVVATDNPIGVPSRRVAFTREGIHAAIAAEGMVLLMR